MHKDLTNIYRNKTIKSNEVGYSVDITRKNKRYSRYFSDAEYGNSSKALSEAIKYHNEIANEHKYYTKEELLIRNPTKSKTGLAYCYRIKIRKKNAEYYYWVVNYIDNDISKRKCFSEIKLGPLEAERQAKEFRLSNINTSI